MGTCRTAIFAARRWYPATIGECRGAVVGHLEGVAVAEGLPERLVAGIVPHAGWVYSGRTAGRVFRVLAACGAPEVVVFFGSVHVPGVDRPVLWPGDPWGTPLGEIEIEEALVERIARDLPSVRVDREPHRGEHSVELQLPFVRHLWPEARMVALMVPPTADAHDLGRGVARAVRSLGFEAMGIGSTDMTHYGPRYGFTPRGVGVEALEWVRRQNDPRMIERIVSLDAPGVFEEARSNRNACSAGAIVATIGYAQELGATRGALLDYSTSHERFPEEEPVDFVGYSGIVF